MVYIQKGPSPQELIQAKRDGLRCYSDMDTLTKDAIKKSLLQEQNGLCAYCMRKMKLETMQIEHYEAQNPVNGDLDLEKTIDYQNMIGVCPGQKGQTNKFKELTCDQHRGNEPLTVNPLKENTISKISYRSSGEIGSKDEKIQKDLDVTLNLNCQSARLCENRKAALFSFKKWVTKRFSGRTVSRAEWSALKEKIAVAASEQTIEYIGIINWYLDKKIR